MGGKSAQIRRLCKRAKVQGVKSPWKDTYGISAQQALHLTTTVHIESDLKTATSFPPFIISLVAESVDKTAPKTTDAVVAAFLPENNSFGVAARGPDKSKYINIYLQMFEVIELLTRDLISAMRIDSSGWTVFLRAPCRLFVSARRDDWLGFGCNYWMQYNSKAFFKLFAFSPLRASAGDFYSFNPSSVFSVYVAPHKQKRLGRQLYFIRRSNLYE